MSPGTKYAMIWRRPSSRVLYRQAHPSRKTLTPRGLSPSCTMSSRGATRLTRWAAATLSTSLSPTESLANCSSLRMRNVAMFASPLPDRTLPKPPSRDGSRLETTKISVRIGLSFMDHGAG